MDEVEGVLWQTILLTVMVATPLVWFYFLDGDELVSRVREGNFDAIWKHAVEIPAPTFLIATGLMLLLEGRMYLSLPMGIVPDWVPIFGSMDNSCAQLIFSVGIILTAFGGALVYYKEQDKGLIRVSLDFMAMLSWLNGKTETGKSNKSEPVDSLRDTPLRLLGYANEVGESFKPMVSKRVYYGSYCVSIGYVVTDTVDKALKARNDPSSNSWLSAAADTLLWQLSASVVVPGFTVNRVVWASSMAVRLWAPALVKTLPTAFGLLSIPFIVHPIDSSVHWVMDNTTRPAMGIKRHVGTGS